MWLALDIGNSVAKGGLFEGAALRRTFRLAFDPESDDGLAALRAALAADARRIARVGVASVVPAATEAAEAALARAIGPSMPVLRVSHRLRLPFALAYETPETLGADRLAAAAAAWTRHGRAQEGRSARAVVALDAGTAVTYEVVDAGGTYRGGAIAPGPGLLRDALHGGTAQLSRVPLDVPPRPDGRSTQEAIQSGLLHGFLDAAAGMIARLSDALEEPPVVVATGGWSGLLAEHLPAIDHTEPHLVLHGVRALMLLNRDEEAKRRGGEE